MGLQGGMGFGQGPAGTAEGLVFSNRFKEIERIADCSYFAIAKEISNELGPKPPADRHIDDRLSAEDR